jgi:hypothetical protein
MKNSIVNRRFDRHQYVSFIGGEGIIKGFKFENGKWKYAIEMPLGVEPQFGRIGAETIVVLDEIELNALEDVGELNPVKLKI